MKSTSISVPPSLAICRRIVLLPRRSSWSATADQVHRSGVCCRRIPSHRAQRLRLAAEKAWHRNQIGPEHSPYMAIRKETTCSPILFPEVRIILSCSSTVTSGRRAAAARFCSDGFGERDPKDYFSYLSTRSRCDTAQLPCLPTYVDICSALPSLVGISSRARLQGSPS